MELAQLCGQSFGKMYFIINSSAIETSLHLTLFIAALFNISLASLYIGSFVNSSTTNPNHFLIVYPVHFGLPYFKEGRYRMFPSKPTANSPSIVLLFYDLMYDKEGNGVMNTGLRDGSVYIYLRDFVTSFEISMLICEYDFILFFTFVKISTYILSFIAIQYQRKYLQ